MRLCSCDGENISVGESTGSFSQKELPNKPVNHFNWVLKLGFLPKT